MYVERRGIGEGEGVKEEGREGGEGVRECLDFLLYSV